MELNELFEGLNKIVDDLNSKIESQKRLIASLEAEKQELKEIRTRSEANLGEATLKLNKFKKLFESVDKEG